MAYIVDTNATARRVLPADPGHPVVFQAISRLRHEGEILYITPQILVEFRALATRPVVANGFGMTASQASLEARKIEGLFPLLEEIPAIYHFWNLLVDNYGVVGRQVYDARIVAVMQAYGISHLLTMNPTHFRRFTEITVVEPKDV